MIGNGNINGIFTKQVSFGDTLAPCLALNYSLGQQDEESAQVHFYNATFEVSEPSTVPVLTVTLESRSETQVNATDITYTITGAAAKVAWAGTTPTFTASASTLKEVIDLLNEIAGIQAFALHAPHWASMDVETFLVAAVANIPNQPGEYLKTLYRDVSDYVIGAGSAEVAWLRLGLPEVRDAGLIKLISVGGTCTGETGDATVRIYRDDIRDYGTEYNATYATMILLKQLYLDKALAAAQTEYIEHTILNANTVQGPIIVECKSNNLTATTIQVRYMQASL